MSCSNSTDNSDVWEDAKQRRLLELEDELLEDILKILPTFPLDEVKNMIDYNVPKGFHRVKAFEEVYKAVVVTPSAHQKQLADTLGCLLLFHQAAVVITDDFIDGSEFRNGVPTWHKMVGPALAVNHAKFLEEVYFRLLKKHLGDDPEAYLQFVDASHQSTFSLYTGLIAEDFVSGNVKPTWNMETYLNNTREKIVYYYLYFPVRVALAVANLNKDQIGKILKHFLTVIYSLGELFQMIDDFVDLYGPPEKTGKDGSDVKSGKLTWPYILAMKIIDLNADPAERVTKEDIAEAYNSCDKEKILKLYQSLSIKGHFDNFMEQKASQIRNEIICIPDEYNSLKTAFHGFLAFTKQFACSLDFTVTPK